MMNMDNEPHITDVEDMNDDPRNADDSNGELDGGNNEGDDMTDTTDDDTDSGVLHGEVLTPGGDNRALAIDSTSPDAAAFYNGFDAETASDLRNAAVEAKLKMLDSRDSALEAGRILHKVQVQLGHSNYGKWLKVEFPGSRKTAQNFVALAMVADTALEFGEAAESKILALPATVLYEVGTDNLPEQDRKEVIDLYVNGELSDKKEVIEEVRKRKAAEKDRRDSALEAAGKAPKAKKESGGEGETRTYEEEMEEFKFEQRQYAIWQLASGIIEGKTEADSIVALYGEIGTGRGKKLTPEDHQEVSVTLLNVTKAFIKDPVNGIEKLKPTVRPEPDKPVKKGRKSKAKTETGEEEQGDD